MQRPQITLRFGAAADDVTVDGHTFTRHKLQHSDRAMIRGEVIKALGKTGGLDAAEVDQWERERRKRRKMARKSRKASQK